MIAGLYYVIYLLSGIYRRLLPGRFAGKAKGDEGASQNWEEEDRYDTIDGYTGVRSKPLQAEPSMVNVNGFGQSIAVLTSGGDAQGWL